MLLLFLILIYASIVFELVFFPVPSVASTYQLFSPEAAKELPPDSRLHKATQYSAFKKFFIFFTPTVIGNLTFCLPLVCAFFPILKNYLGYFHFLDRPIFLVLGVGLILVSRIISFSSTINMRKDNSQQGDEFSLKTTQFFKLTRNPILVATHLTMFGLFFFAPSLVLLIGILIYLVNMHSKVLLEEDFLAWKFGKPYKDYLGKTKRYI